MIPRYGNPPMRRRYKLRPGAYVILPRAGGFVLTQQDDPGPEVQLPGGGIDPGEHVLPALHREVAEETGWSIARVRKFKTFRQFTYMPEYAIWAEKICHVYVAHPARQLGAPTEAGHSVLWLDPINAIEAIGSAGGRAALADYVSRASGM
ncbi:MAG: NUDIX hydrolase [Pseudomonadota bacterium]